MGYKTFVNGEVLNADDVMDFLMDQAVIVCTSGTRPSSPVEGMMIYETDTNRIYVHDGTNWRLGTRTNVIARASRTGGDVASSSTTWANFDTGIDLTIPAATGDMIEVGASGLWSGSNSDVTHGDLDVVTMVSGSPVNSFGSQGSPNNGHTGISGWVSGQVTGGATAGVPVSGGALLVLQSGDISGGNVTLRLRIKVGSATARTVFANSTTQFRWWAKNLGLAV